VTLSSVFNVHGIFNNGTAVTNGGLDTYGFAFSGNLLGSSATWLGTTFTLGAANVSDAVSGGTITLPSGSFATLKLLATGIRGNQLNQSFVVTYTDGTTTTVEQSLSDWFTPQGYVGETKAVTMAYRVNANGTTGVGPFYLSGYTLAIDASKTVKSLTLPANRNVVVFAAALGQ
jgi:hypothetical protein